MLQKLAFRLPSFNIVVAAAVKPHLRSNRASCREQILGRWSAAAPPSPPPPLATISSLSPWSRGSTLAPTFVNSNPNYQGKQGESLAIPTNCLLHEVVEEAESNGGGSPRVYRAAILGHTAAPLLPSAALLSPACLSSVPLLPYPHILGYAKSLVSPLAHWRPPHPPVHPGSVRGG